MSSSDEDFPGFSDGDQQSQNAADPDVADDPQPGSSGLQQPVSGIPAPMERFFESLINRLPALQPAAQVILPPQPLRFAKFDPAKDDADTWVRSAEIIVNARNNLQTADLVTALTLAFEGTNASRWLGGVLVPDLTWPQFRLLFELQYGTIDTPAAKFYRALTARSSDGDQAALVSEHLTKLQAAMRGVDGEKVVLYFMTAIAARNEVELRKWAMTQMDITGPELLRKLKAIKLVRPHQQQQNRNNSGGKKTDQQNGQSRPQKRGLPGTSGPPAKRGRFDASQSRQPQPQQNNKWCHLHNTAGHDFAQCFRNPRNIGNTGRGGRGNGNGNRGRGGNFNGQRRPGQNQNNQAQAQERQVRQCDANPVGSLQQQGKKFGFIFDSGSECSLMIQRVACQISGQMYHNPIALIGLGNSRVVCEKQLSATVNIDNLDLAINFIIVPDNLLKKTEVLIGREILQQNLKVLIFPDRYEFHKIEKPKTGDSKFKYFKTAKQMTPKVTNIIHDVPSTSTAISKDNSFKSQITPTPKINKDPSSNIMAGDPVWETPCRYPVIDLQVDSITATESTPSRTPTLQGSTLGENPIFDPLSEPLDTDLVQPDDVTKLRQILYKFSDFFTRGLPKHAVTTAEFNIQLRDPTKVINRRPYRLAPRDRQAVRDYIKELLDASIIQESVSEWSFPCLLVPKKNGKLRLCTDFRLLNQNLVPERYPIPLIADQIARLNGQKYFSSIDCASGFYGIKVGENTRKILAFSTPDGHFEYLRLPFGISNAPCAFQRAVINALGPLAESYVLAYLDDLLIISETIEEGLSRLDEVLTVLAKAGFTLNPDKCSFLKTSIVYLGYEVKGGEITPHNEKIKALTELPPPTDRTSLRSFLGFCSYFRQFVRDFSQVCAPLYRLTSDKTKFEWTSEHESLRQRLISVFTSHPVLTVFNPDLKIEVHCDSSSVGFGAILMNVEPSGAKKIVGYFSRRTTPTESNYHSYELETLGAVKCFKFWEHFLLYHPFVLYTDCRSFQLSYLKKELVTKIQRWWAWLQIFEFTIVHKPGTQMRAVDFFSRYPVGEPSEVDVFEASVESYPPTTWNIEYKKIRSLTEQQFPDSKRKEHELRAVDLIELSGDWLRIAQAQDDEIQVLIEQLEHRVMNPDVAKTYVIKQGILHRVFQHNKKTRTCPIVPFQYKYIIVHTIHDSLLHCGYPKTIDAILNKFWFKGVTKFVRKFLDQCVTCKLAKPKSGKVQMQRYMIPKNPVPMDTLHLDVTGRLSGPGSSPDYYLASICAYTKFIFLHHTKNLTAGAAVNSLKEIIALFGIPRRVVVDQGGCYMSTLFTSFCEGHGIECHPISTGSPRSNAQIERFMKSIVSLVAVSQLTRKETIRSLAPKIQLVINATVNRTTGFSAIELLTGVRPEVPGTLFLDESLKPPIRSNLDEIRAEASENISRSQQYEMQRFQGTKAPVVPLQLGDLVVREVEKRTRTKTAPAFAGTYKIIELLPNDRYLIQNLNSGRIHKYPHDRLKLITHHTDLLPTLLNFDDSDLSDAEEEHT